MKTTGDLKLNPLKTIWYKPRKTIQFLSHRYSLKTLLIINSFVYISTYTRDIKPEQITFNPIIDLNKTIFQIVLGIIIFPFLIPFLAYIEIPISSYFLRTTGRIFDGKANSKEMKTVITWSRFPICILLLTFIIKIILFQIVKIFGISEVFYDYSSKLIGYFELFLVLYFLYLSVIFLSEVQKFSSFKAILNYLFGMIGYSICFIIFALVFLTAITTCF